MLILINILNLHLVLDLILIIFFNPQFLFITFITSTITFGADNSLSVCFDDDDDDNNINNNNKIPRDQEILG